MKKLLWFFVYFDRLELRTYPTVGVLEAKYYTVGLDSVETAYRLVPIGKNLVIALMRDVEEFKYYGTLIGPFC